MRNTCPGSGEFATVWAAVFTCLIPAGVPLILFIMLVAHGVPSLADKKRNLSLLQGVLQTFGKEINEAAVENIYKSLLALGVGDRSAVRTPVEWFDHSKSRDRPDSCDDEETSKQMQALSKIMRYTYPFGKEKMTYTEILYSVDAQRRTLQYIPSNKFDVPDDEAILLVLLAYCVRRLGDYGRGAAERSTSLFSLVHKATRRYGVESNKDNESDNEVWKKMFNESIFSVKPPQSKETDDYPGCTRKLDNMSTSQAKALRKELAQQLYMNASRLHSAKLLSVQEPSWNASELAGHAERKTVLRLGFLFQSYRPSAWYESCMDICVCVCLCLCIENCVFLY
jgi:hypothetical protein